MKRSAYPRDLSEAQWEVLARALPATPKSAGPSSRNQSQRDRERNFLCSAFWLPVAYGAIGFSQMEDRLSLLPSMAIGRHVGNDT